MSGDSISAETGRDASVDWRAVWPIPLLAAATLLLIAAVVTAVLTVPEVDVWGALGRANEHIEQERFEAAIDVLNEDRVRGHINDGSAGVEAQQEFFRTRAAAFSLAQASMGINEVSNHNQVIADYKQAEALGMTLGPADVDRLSASLLAIGNVAEASERALSISHEGAERRRRAIRRIIEHNLSAPDVRAEMTEELLAELALDTRMPAEERLWTSARQAELLIESGRYDEAVTRLLKDLTRYQRETTDEQRAELHLLLGRAYFNLGELTNAVKHLVQAEEAVGPLDEMRAEASVLLGRVHQARAELDEARDRFMSVRSEFPGTEAYVPALLGLAEVEASLNNDDEAVQVYAELVERARRDPRRRGVTRQTVHDSLMSRWRDRYLAEGYRKALAYADLADSLYAAGEVPLDVTLAVADSHRAMAVSLLEDDSGRMMSHRQIREMDPVSRATARRHLLEAGEHYLEHSDGVLLSNNEGYLESLWLAADSFDLAGDYERAAAAFGRYRDGASEADQRRPEAQFRLAQIFHAQEDYTIAAQQYRDLLDRRAAKGVGPWANRSVVPLAQCYLRDDDPVNDGEAEDLLQSVVNGSIVTPEAQEFRDAIRELAMITYKTGRFADAVELLDEFVSRYPEDPQIDRTRFLLADSYRRLADSIEESLEQAMPVAERQAHQAQRREALASAVSLYRSVRSALGRKVASERTAVERLYLRNSYFYIGDCLFDLGEYADAIDAYSDAANVYAAHPSSLVAKVQIVNAYVNMGRWDDARTAQERARQHYKSLTDKHGSEVWDDPTLPMEQKHWERWLDTSRQLEQQASATPE